MKQTIKKLLSISIVASLPFSTAIAEGTEKIVSAGASVTELIYALGAQSQLVGVDVTSVTPKGSPLPKVGYHRALSAEGLIALEPTIVIGSDEMGPKPALDQLERVGVDIEIVDTAPTIEGLNTRIDQIAKLTDTEVNAPALKSNIAKQVNALTSNQPQENEAKKVLFLLIHEGRPANVAGNATTPDAIIELAGGINPAAASIDSYKPISNEAIIEMQPDVVLVSGRSYAKLGGSDAVLKALPMLSATPAGQNNAIVTIDGHALVGGLGLKSLEEAKRINALLYP
ncbi:ABC transporter substrate-binding protein [Vibrio sp. SCSIO 43140]|uniref:heme/hemin ABC transporter substrate-binding protein n=1 Tax=Vibrio sp. SCSIO 43140 TaxID=2819100 RepID=UPI002075C6D3|nr:ABC transporter substrate-binding protein [Vibrio sp. SCSIO 43140]USD63544.1 ABC transporter substrate-binding protein [Vibrio sp. SCSIO 43140]